MLPTGPGERAVRVAWVWPDGDSLLAIADRPSAVTWAEVRQSPGLLFAIINRGLTLPTPDRSIRLHELDLLAFADDLDRGDVPTLDLGMTEPLLRTIVAAARFAELLAGQGEGPRAWTATWVAFGGWLAIASVAPETVPDVIDGQSPDPRTDQQLHWGLSRAEISWALSNHWRLPMWARCPLARLDAPPKQVESFGGDATIQAIVQVAMLLGEQAETNLRSTEEFDLAEALSHLKLRTTDLDLIREKFNSESFVDRWLDRNWTEPAGVPGLTNRLREAAHQMAEHSSADETVLIDTTSERIQAAKMAAVAEFAAGAGHEINNPLAVISGHSQYLLRYETDDNCRKSLLSIIRQTERVHALLTELMYFARPPEMKRQTVEIVSLLRDVVDNVKAMAIHRQVEVQIVNSTPDLWIDADPKYLNIALAALIRNGVEAAPIGGWVKVRTAFLSDRIEIIVDDSGPGPDPRSRDHLFDPFYSGRTAGRGRGLGLPAAWRLAQEHGGTVKFVPLNNGPTRFVLSLPASAVISQAQRKSA